MTEGHLSQVLDAKSAPTGHFRTKAMPQNVHYAIGVSVNTMRSSKLAQAPLTPSALVSLDSTTIPT